MNRRAIKVFSLAVLLAIGISGCGGEAPQQKTSEGRLEKMKPKKGDSLSKLMERDWNNVEYIMYGFINFDKHKIKTATDNLPPLSGYIISGITHSYKEHKAEWQEQRQAINESAAELKREFEQENFAEAQKHFHNITKNCMDCHKQYRKYLKPKQKLSETQLADMKPHAEDSLTIVMDRSWDNLKYMMYGFINYDDVRMKTTTENLIALGDSMAQNITPEHKVHAAAWNEQCNRQKELAANIRRDFEQENFEESHNQVSKLIENCMDCHKLYRKHLLRSESEER